MADPRFFRARGPFSLAELASLAEAELGRGDPAQLIHDVAPLESAGPGHITFLDNPKYIDAARATRAAACVIRPDLVDRLPAEAAALLSQQPYRSYARIATAFYPDAGVPTPLQPRVADISAHAVIDPDASVGIDCQIAAGAVIEAGAVVGARCQIDANAVIGRGVVLGQDCVIGAGATLSHCIVGDRVIIHPGVRIGQDGFGFAMSRSGHVKVPQIGRVLIEDDVEIGANSTIDRGSGPDTVIGRGCKIDNLVMIAHNVQLGPGCIVVAQSGISGSTRIGAGSVLAAQVGVTGHLTLGEGVQLAARAAATRDLPGGEIYGGAPAVPIRQWRRQMAMIHRFGKRKGEAP
jgi:UDP-3-O-[3-hydroxymyristoyl] glucosamine N-acyltransferase